MNRWLSTLAWPIVLFILIALPACRRHSHDSAAATPQTPRTPTSWAEFLSQHWAEIYSIQVIRQGDDSFVNLSEKGKGLLLEVLKSAKYKTIDAGGKLIQILPPPTAFHFTTLGGASMHLNVSETFMMMELEMFDVDKKVARELLEEVDRLRKRAGP